MPILKESGVSEPRVNSNSNSSVFHTAQSFRAYSRSLFDDFPPNHLRGSGQKVGQLIRHRENGQEPLAGGENVRKEGMLKKARSGQFPFVRGKRQARVHEFKINIITDSSQNPPEVVC